MPWSSCTLWDDHNQCAGLLFKSMEGCLTLCDFYSQYFSDTPDFSSEAAVGQALKKFPCADQKKRRIYSLYVALKLQ